MKRQIQIAIILLSFIVALSAWADIDKDLEKAVEQGDTAQVKILINKGADIGTKNYSLPLYSAISKCHKETALLLILDFGHFCSINFH